ncbi:protein of unknown function [Ruminococcaceae bacterium BL-4]|nr:protein of unknown function [Ruminococcaceae bacterium BL-4]
MQKLKRKQKQKEQIKSILRKDRFFSRQALYFYRKKRYNHLARIVQVDDKFTNGGIK